MNTKYAERIWEERKRNLPSNLSLQGLEQNLMEWAEKHSADETMFVIEHNLHGKVILKHVQILEENVVLSQEHNSWERGQEHDMIKWEYYLICKNCHASHVVVDENTPNEFRGI